ncbi:MAG TPA: cysteine desulfurase [Solirubrobacteraceae bacterium]|jgi:cysteine desulfurase/selenocysteine lyase|nr:cysteine desulfurase [Solirubrobacteraceae bacterium]
MTAPSSTGLDLRADFPILAREIDGHPLVYLDSASTSQKPEQVLTALDDYYRNHNANIHRGVYALAQEADALFEGARGRIAAFVNWPTAATIFTRNVTEAINLVAYSWGRTNLRPGQVVLLTQMEHHSNIVPWQLAAQATGATLRYLDVDGDGKLSLEQLDAELARGDVALVALAHVSNVLGTINPVAEVVSRAHAAGALVLIDGAQAVPQMPVDLRAIDADFYAWTGHKALGPTGVGVLHARAELLEEMPPFLSGGDMIATVEAQSSTWNALPWKFEAGTSMIAQAIGLGAAIDYLGALGMSNVRSHEQSLTAAALERLAAMAGVRVFGPPAASDRGGVIAFALDGIHPHDVGELLGRRGVCVRASHHCAQPLMRVLGVVATARASFGPYNVAADIDALAEAIAEAQEVFAG